MCFRSGLPHGCVGLLVKTRSLFLASRQFWQRRYTLRSYQGASFSHRAVLGLPVCSASLPSHSCHVTASSFLVLRLTTWWSERGLRRLRVHAVFEYMDMVTLTFLRGDGIGGHSVRSPCFPFTPYTRHCHLGSLYSRSPLSSRPRPLGSGGDVTPCEDTREDFRLHFLYLPPQVLLQCGFQVSSPAGHHHARSSRESRGSCFQSREKQSNGNSLGTDLRTGRHRPKNQSSGRYPLVCLRLRFDPDVDGCALEVVRRYGRPGGCMIGVVWCGPDVLSCGLLLSSTTVSFAFGNTARRRNGESAEMQRQLHNTGDPPWKWRSCRYLQQVQDALQVVGACCKPDQLSVASSVGLAAAFAPQFSQQLSSFEGLISEAGSHRVFSRSLGLGRDRGRPELGDWTGDRETSLAARRQ